MKMTLDKVVTGKQRKPVRLLMHGTEGVGKSTFAASAPAPIFLCAESGTNHLDIARFPTPESWGDVLDAVSTLTTEKHEYQTLVVDTVDWLEPLCFAHVIATAPMDKSGKKPTCIEDVGGGYGRGYTAAVDAWIGLMARLERLQHEHKMHVVVLAHSWIKAFANPEGADYDRFELKLNKNASAKWREWVDAMLFATYDTAVKIDGQKTTGISTGSRIVRTERRAAFDAKNRYGLPFQLPLDWSEFWTAYEAGQPVDIQSTIDEALALVKGNAELHAKVSAMAAKVGKDATKAAQLLDWTRGKMSTTQEAK